MIEVAITIHHKNNSSECLQTKSFILIKRKIATSTYSYSYWIYGSSNILKLSLISIFIRV